MENANIAANAATARIYVKDEVLVAIIKANFRANAKTSEITKGLKAMGYSAAPYRVNRLMGRYTKNFTAKADALTPNKLALLNGVRDYAVEHYNDGGWDYVVESFSAQEILGVLGESWTVSGAIAKMAKHLAPLAAARDEVKAEVF
jgi:hypothetical protein